MDGPSRGIDLPRLMRQVPQELRGAEMAGLKQGVSLTLTVRNHQYYEGRTVATLTCDPVTETLEAVTHKNIRSKVSEAVKRMLTSYNTTDGATLVVTIDPCEPDEFANPER